MSETSGKPAAKRSRNAEETAMRARTEADIAFIDSLARVLRENDLAEISVSREYGDHELEVKLSRTVAMAPPVAAAVPAALAAPPGAPQLAAPGAALERVEADDAVDAVTAPMVGTVYLAPEPDAANFISVGDRVEEGQTLLIIEAMKTMNHIPSPKAGEVKKILVSNGQPVEYGAPLLVIA